MSYLAAVERELGKLPTDLAESIEAATVRMMAEKVDAGKGSISECGKLVLDGMKTLRALAPPKRERDSIDDLAERRRQRLAIGIAATADLPGS